MNELVKIKLSRHICRVTPLGMAPMAPGTAGSVLGVLLAVLAFRVGFAAYMAALIIVVFGGTWAAEIYERRARVHDDRRIVIDEVAGMMVALAGWETPDPVVTLLAFVAFRALDILKPWPISWVEGRVGGGVGVMADDLAAGVFTIIFLEILRPFI